MSKIELQNLNHLFNPLQEWFQPVLIAFTMAVQESQHFTLSFICPSHTWPHKSCIKIFNLKLFKGRYRHCTLQQPQFFFLHWALIKALHWIQNTVHSYSSEIIERTRKIRANNCDKVDINSPSLWSFRSTLTLGSFSKSFPSSAIETNDFKIYVNSWTL